MKKSFLSMLMIAALMLTLCACGGTAPAESETPAAAEIPVQEDDGQIIVSETTEEDSGRQDGERKKDPDLHAVAFLVVRRGSWHSQLVLRLR